MPMTRILAILFSLALAAPAPAQDGEVCADAPMIASLAKATLDERDGLPGFAPSRFGDVEAYLMAHYGRLDDGASERLFRDLTRTQRPPHRAEELLATFLTARQGGLAGLAIHGTDPIAAMTRLGPSETRALLREGQGQIYFQLLTELRARQDDFPEFRLPLALYNIGTVILDLPEEERLAIAEAAERYGETVVAGRILATLSDLSPFEALLERHGGDADIADELSWSALERVGATWLSQQVPARRADDTDESYAIRHAMHRIIRADALGGPLAYLSLLANMTGEVEAIALAAEASLAAVGSGEIDPMREPERLLLLQRVMLNAALPNGQLPDALNGFDFPSPSLRHFSGRAGHVLDMMLALDWVTSGGDPAGADPMPALFGDAENWRADLLAARELIEGGPVTDASTLVVDLAIEILWREGKRELALARAEEWLAPEDMARLRHDLMRRLDLGCDGLTHMPGQAIYFADFVVFRFDPI